MSTAGEITEITIIVIIRGAKREEQKKGRGAASRGRTAPARAAPCLVNATTQFCRAWQIIAVICRPRRPCQKRDKHLFQEGDYHNVEPNVPIQTTAVIACFSDDYSTDHRRHKPREVPPSCSTIVAVHTQRHYCHKYVASTLAQTQLQLC
jgi:hypothetical protein